MALAYGILVFFPLQRLIDFYYGSRIFDGIVQVRLEAVNGLTPEKYQTLVSRPAWRTLPAQVKYIALCSYQGELTDWAPVFVPATHLARRAELLQDVAAYRLYMAMLNQNDRAARVATALHTGNPALQAVALTMGGPGDKLQPEDIPWTKGLVAYYRSLRQAKLIPRTGFSSNDLMLIGYLGLESLREGVRKFKRGIDETIFLTGYFLARAEEAADGIIRLTQEEKDVLSKSTTRATFRGGLPVVMAEAGCIDPELVEGHFPQLYEREQPPESIYRLLMRDALMDYRTKLIPFLATKIEPDSATTSRINLFPEDGQKCREIVAILGEKAPVNFQICGGLPLSIEEVRRRGLTRRLLEVAHPQLTELTEEEETNFGPYMSSHLLYDPLTLFRHFGLKVPISEEAYARGLLTQIMQMPAFSDWTFPPARMEYGLPSWSISRTGRDAFPILAARVKLAQEMGLPSRGMSIGQEKAANQSEARKLNILQGRNPDYPSEQYVAEAQLDRQIWTTYQILIS